MKEKTNYSIAYLRIFAMLCVIGLHLFGQGGLLTSFFLKSNSYFVLNIMYTILFTCINIFGIMSGFLLCKKEKTNMKRFWNIIFITLFYSFLITAVFYIFNLYKVRDLPKSSYNMYQYLISGTKNTSTNFNALINSLFPLYWYVTSYLFVLLMVPYINKLIKSLTKEEFKKLLILLFVLISVIPTFVCYLDLFKLSYGYSPFWLLYMYMIGAYIKFYNEDFKYSNKKYLLIVLLITIISSSLNFFTIQLSKNVLNTSRHTIRFIDYISPFNVLLSALIFNIFINMKIKDNKFNRLIYQISKTTFAIYVIHVHPLIYKNVLDDLLISFNKYNILLVFVYVITYILAIFIICSLIEFIRILLLKIAKKIL